MGKIVHTACGEGGERRVESFEVTAAGVSVPEV